MKRLTVGDGIAVVALLAFAAGWVFAHILVLENATVDAGTGIVLILVMVLPFLWALGKVSEIISGE